MANEGATEFGSIKAVLTLDKSDYVAGLKAAGVQADELGRHDPKIKINVQGAQAAIAQMVAVKNAQDRLNVATARLDEIRTNGKAKRSTVLAAERQVALAMQAVAAATSKAAESEDQLDESNKKVAKSASEAHRRHRALLTAIIALGPAIVPVAAATVGLGAGFAAAGVAGVLAIVGIKREMAAGTTTGAAFTKQVGLLKDNVDDLSTLAAKGVLGPFQDAVADLQRRMPQLTSMVGDFSSVTGQTASALFRGLLAAFIQLEPLMADVGMYTLDLSHRFEALMSGPGVVAFGDYVRSVFPQVMGDLEDIVGAVVHLVAAFAPLGTGVLGMLGLLSQLISAIPVDVLATLATTAYSVYAGFKTFTIIQGLIGGVTKGLISLGLASETAAGGLRALNLAAGAIGAVIAVATFLYTQHAEAVRQDQQAVDDYTQALRQSNGVIDENVRATAFKQLQDEGAYRAAKQLGIGLDVVTDAALGNKDAVAAVSAKMLEAMRAQDEFTAGGKRTNLTTGELNNAVHVLSSTLGTNHDQFTRAQQAQKDWAEASKVSAAASGEQGTAQSNLAASLGITTTALQGAQDAQKKTADAAATATTNMQLENDAAGLLKQSLDLLNGKALDAAAAQTASASATLGAVRALKDHDKKAKDYGTTLSLNTEKGVAARQALERKAQADQQAAEAVAKATGSTKAGTKSLQDNKIALENTLRSQGLLTDKVQAYIDKIYQIPKKVPPTKVEIDQAAKRKALADIAALKSALAGIQSKTVVVTTLGRFVNQTPRKDGGRSTAGGSTFGAATGGLVSDVMAGLKRFDGGGRITGPGTGTSDSILALVGAGQDAIRVSANEFVATASSYRRNAAALEAGNRGATLTADGGGRMVAIDAASIAAIAAAVSRVQVRSVVTAGQFDAAMGARMR